MADGHQVVRLASPQSWVVMDKSMPDLNGLEANREIPKNHTHHRGTETRRKTKNTGPKREGIEETEVTEGAIATRRAVPGRNMPPRASGGVSPNAAVPHLYPLWPPLAPCSPALTFLWVSVPLW